MPILVLGLGNLIMSDDGVGIRVVQLLDERYCFPPGVAIVDGGTLGLDLLPKLEGVNKLILVDAVETGELPGTVVRLADDQVPIALENEVSPHQVGLKDLLAVAMLLGFQPSEMVLWGVQPEQLELGTELSPPVASQLQTLVNGVVSELAGWGVTVLDHARNEGLRLRRPAPQALRSSSRSQPVP